MKNAKYDCMFIHKEATDEVISTTLKPYEDFINENNGEIKLIDKKKFDFQLEDDIKEGIRVLVDFILPFELIKELVKKMKQDENIIRGIFIPKGFVEEQEICYELEK